MKKFCVVAAFAIVLQIFFFIWRSFQYPVDEDFRQLVKKYEGLRYTEAREQVNADKSQISERNFERIMAQIDWMEDVEHSHVTAYLPQAEKGYVYVEIPKEKSGIEGLAEEKAIPLLVYREGYKELFGVGEEIFDLVFEPAFVETSATDPYRGICFLYAAGVCGDSCGISEQRSGFSMWSVRCVGCGKRTEI